MRNVNRGNGDMATKIWAHRGASGYAPENTIPAFKLAVEQGADGVELDVHMSSDGKLTTERWTALQTVRAAWWI